MLKMEESKRIFAEWQSQIEVFPKLKFKEAKKLYQAFLKEENRQEQKKIRDELICGTLHFISKQINNNTIFFLPNRLFDMNDVINVYIEEWIKQIDAGSLLNTERLSFIFNSTFTFNVVSNLVGKGESQTLLISDFPNLFINYLTLKRKQDIVSLDDLLNLLDWRSTWYDENNLVAIYNILEKLTNALEEYNIKMGKEKAKRFKYLLIIYAMELLSIDIDKVQCEDISEQVIDHMYYAQVVKEVLDSDLTDREKDILVMRFGLNGSNSSSYDTIAKKYNVTWCRIMQIETKALRRLRHPSRLKDIRF